MKIKWFFLSMVITIATVLAGCEPLMVLDPKGPQAERQAHDILLSIGIMSVVIIVVFVLLVYMLVKYRASKMPEDYEPPHIEGNPWVEQFRAHGPADAGLDGRLALARPDGMHRADIVDIDQDEARLDARHVEGARADGRDLMGLAQAEQGLPEPERILRLDPELIAQIAGDSRRGRCAANGRRPWSRECRNGAGSRCPTTPRACRMSREVGPWRARPQKRSLISSIATSKP